MPLAPTYYQTGFYHVPSGTDVMVGDTVSGIGIVPGTVVTNTQMIVATPGGWNGWALDSTYIEITISQLVTTGDIPFSNNYNYNPITSNFTGLDYGGWTTEMSFSRLETFTKSDPIVYLSGSTLSFREDVKGWVSFKSFVSDNSISCANEYYSFTSSVSNPQKGLWIHHDESVSRNTFYNTYTPSTVSVIFNDIPGSVKSFKTLNYEGSQARVLEGVAYVGPKGQSFYDGEYYNLTATNGWFVSSAFTNLEDGGISEFIEKEGKWFGYFIGIDENVNSSGIVVDNYKTADFSVQGIGGVSNVATAVVYGCDQPSSFNYNPAATVPDGSCVDVSNGCIDPSAANYDILANTDDGTCQYLGCIDATMFNYDSNANTDDGSCIPVVSGCSDLNSWNYNPNANTSTPSTCIAYVYGCTDGSIDVLTGLQVPIANNYDPLANTDDGSCVYGGCTDLLSCNYSSIALTDDGSCVYCGDDEAMNADTPLHSCYTYCSYCLPIGSAHLFSAVTDTSFTMTWSPTTYNHNTSILNPGLLLGGSAAPTVQWIIEAPGTGLTIPPATSANTTVDALTGLVSYNVTGIPAVTGQVGQALTITITNDCGGLNMVPVGSTVNLPPTPVLGCTDAIACNYNAAANIDDGTCDYTSCTGCTDMLYLEGCNTCWDAINLVAVTDGSGSAFVSDDGSCSTLINVGCFVNNATNYDVNVNVADNTTCEYCLLSPGSAITGYPTDSFNLYTNQIAFDTPLHYPSGLYNRIDFQLHLPNFTSGILTQVAPLGDITIELMVTASDTTNLNGPPGTVIDSVTLSGPFDANTTGAFSSSNPGTYFGYFDNVGTTGLAGDPFRIEPASDYDLNVYATCTASNGYTQNIIGGSNGTPPQGPITTGPAPIYGCTDVTMFNYDTLATLQETSATDTTDPCYPIINGCLESDNPMYLDDPNSPNLQTDANTDDGSCIVLGSTFFGGTVYYILQPGDPGYDANLKHGLIAGVGDTTTFPLKVWGCDDQQYGASNAFAIGDGLATSTQYANLASGICQGINGIAPAIRAALGGYLPASQPSPGDPDWFFVPPGYSYPVYFLPSAGELKLLFEAPANTFYTFDSAPSDKYWTASELAANGVVVLARQNPGQNTFFAKNPTLLRWIPITSF